MDLVEVHLVLIPMCPPSERKPTTCQRPSIALVRSAPSKVVTLTTPPLQPPTTPDHHHGSPPISSQRRRVGPRSPLVDVATAPCASGWPSSSRFARSGPRRWCRQGRWHRLKCRSAGAAVPRRRPTASPARPSRWRGCVVAPLDRRWRCLPGFAFPRRRPRRLRPWSPRRSEQRWRASRWRRATRRRRASRRTWSWSWMWTWTWTWPRARARRGTRWRARWSSRWRPWRSSRRSSLRSPRWPFWRPARRRPASRRGGPRRGGCHRVGRVRHRRRGELASTVPRGPRLPLPLPSSPPTRDGSDGRRWVRPLPHPALARARPSPALP